MRTTLFGWFVGVVLGLCALWVSPVGQPLRLWAVVTASDVGYRIERFAERQVLRWYDVATAEMSDLTLMEVASESCAKDCRGRQAKYGCSEETFELCYATCGLDRFKEWKRQKQEARERITHGPPEPMPATVPEDSI